YQIVFPFSLRRSTAVVDTDGVSGALAAATALVASLTHERAAAGPATLCAEAVFSASPLTAAATMLSNATAPRSIFVFFCTRFISLLPTFVDETGLAASAARVPAAHESRRQGTTSYSRRALVRREN